MSPHGSITEPSRTDSLRPPIRKGREGKGREVGHPCLSSNWGRSNRPQMDGGSAALSNGWKF